MERIDISNVKKVYSGKPGCMCGCLGIYRYPSSITLKQIGDARGYICTEPRMINDRQVNKVVDLLNYCITDYHGDDLVIDKEYVYVEYQGRAYCAYFTL